MNIPTQVSKKTKTYKIFVLSTAMLFISACSETSTDSEQTNLELNTLSGNVIDASKLTLVQKSELKSSTNATQQSKASETTGSFTYPTTLSEFSGNISVAFDVANPEGIEQVYIGFDGSDLTLPICQQDCGTEYSAFVNGINPALFGLSGSEQNITLWVEDNDNDIYQVTSLGLTWRELAISGVTVTLDESSEELSVSWDALTGMLRYNVYISNDESLTGQNYIDLEGGEAKLSLTGTSTAFTEKSVDDTYYILVSGVDGSGETAFSDTFVLINGTEPTEPAQLTAINDNFVVNEDQVLTGNLLTNDIDESGKFTLKTESTTQPSKGAVIIDSNGDFTYTPNANISGTEQFSYSIEDDTGTISTANVTIVITPINDSPIITSTAPTNATEDIQYTYSSTVSDEDDNNNGTDLTWSLTNAPTGMTISNTGTITWTPTEGQLSSGQVTITVADGGENNSTTSTEKFTINVSSVNDAPVFLDGDAITVSVDENSPNGTIVYIPTINDPDNNATHTFSLNDLSGTFTINALTGVVSVFDNSLLNFEIQKSFNFDITVTDETSLTDTLSITFPLNDLNEKPNIISSAPTTATEDIIYNYTPTVVDDDDVNNGTDLTWSLTNAPTGMTISNTGTITWTPTEGQLSSGQVTITVADGGENNSTTSTEKFTINVSSVNDAPVFLDGDAITVSVDENSPINTQVYTLQVNDPDAGAELTYNLPNGDGVFQLESKAGTIYVSNASLLNFEATSSYIFDIEVKDEFNLSDTITVTISVNDVVENTKYELDTSFSDNGISDFNTYADTVHNDYPLDAVLDDENNRYLLSFSNQLIDGDYVHTLSKLNKDGTFDLAFGNNGRKHLHINNLNDLNVNVFDDSASITTFKPRKIKIDNVNNKIYLLGYQDDGVNAQEAFWLRLNNDGSIDNTFDNDGKFVQTRSSNDIQAVDLVTHSNGYIYLASSSLETSTETKTFILSKFDEQNSATTFVAHNFLSSSSNEQYITGLIENTAGDLVALGYATVNEDTNVIAASIDPDEITKVLNEVEFEFTDLETDAAKTHTNKLSTYNVIDSGTVLLGVARDDRQTGADLAEDYYILIVKLNVDSLALDTTFGGGDGFYSNDKGVNKENLISLDVDSDGNITYINKVTLDSNTYKLFPYQLDSIGETTTTLADTSEDEELAGTSDNVDEGVEDSNINAIVLLEASDSTNTVYIFSNRQKENYNGLSTQELINTEIEIYYEGIADNSSNSELGSSTNRTNYEFQITDSLAIDSKLLHSSGTIITVTPRYNDSGTGDNSDAEGHTITRHDFVTGLINQTFSEEGQNSLVQRNGYSDKYIKRHSSQLVELAETDDNGDNYLLSAEIISNDGASTLRVTKFTIDGEVTSGFPVEKTLPDYAYFESSAYNSTANRVVLFGGAGYDEENNNSLLVVIAVECLADESCQTAISEENLGDTNGLVQNYNRLTSGVVQDDGSVIALGFSAVDDSLKEDVFLLKMNFDDSLDGIIDSDFDNSARDGTENDDDGDDVLTVSTGNSNNVHSGKLIQLSDSSLVYFTTQTESDAQSYLVRLVDTDATSAQKYAIDVKFDDITGGDGEVDGMILLDMDSLSANPLNIEVKDLAVNSEDEIVLVGNVSTTEIDAGFIAKFNGLNGETDSLLGKNSLSGYSIPNGDAGCKYLNTGQNEGDLCDILGYDRVSIANDGSLIIHALLPDYSGSSNNSAILKFKEQQNDNASSYKISNG